MEGVFRWLDGKKTHLTAAIIGILSILEMSGVHIISKIPDQFYMLLGAIGLSSLRDGVEKLKK